MAFLDFAQPLAGPHKAVGASSPVASSRPSVVATDFDAIEWQIVALARTDGLASLREPGRFARLGTLLFGEQASKTLANARLEALRRLAVEAWHKGYTVSLSALRGFRVAGFTSAQLELLLATISAGRSARPRRSYS